MTVRMEEIKVRMINDLNRLCTNEILMKEGAIEMDNYEDRLELVMRIGNIQILDLTNYPDTLVREEEYVEQTELCFLGIQDNKQNLVVLSYKMFYMNHWQMNDQVNSEVDIQISSIQIDLQMQPMFRLLDLVNYNLF